MANRDIPSFLEHPSDREARERAEARDCASKYHNIGRRHYTRQMKHWGSGTASMGGSGGGGTLRRDGTEGYPAARNSGRKRRHMATPSEGS